MFAYLNNSSQCVVIDTTKSAYRELIKGVPQGSVLGPLLFNLYIHDLPSCTKLCVVHIFADDVQIACSANLNNIQQYIYDMNEDLAYATRRR